MAGGIGAVAVGDLLGQVAHGGTAAGAAAVADPLAARTPPLAARAKRMIVIHLTGSPPNLDLYDPKPALVKHDGQECPAEFLAGKKFAFTSGTPKLLGSRRRWSRCGQSGIELSDAIPNLHRVADELCFIKSMHTEQFNHAPAELLVYTGAARAG
ncbi:MAG: DUF1501 domain-containing protein, partial [Planctomycetes bacterium]|nr:DUF1501 domain-containing protein [Planctomycetota bacterium]